MRLIPISLLIFYISASDSTNYIGVKDSLTSYLKSSLKNLKDTLNSALEKSSRYQIKRNDVGDKKPKANILLYGVPSKRNVKNNDHLNGIPKIDRKGNNKYRLDPVLNYISRRKAKKKDSSLSDSSSSSLELRQWKDEWKEHWVYKKFEAVNASPPQGDIVNMVAARPWGVQCGDPDQHDMPWGSCMLPMECDAEYRIYRGDYFCGRTQFVCCAVQLTNYDMYQGFDVSFADSGMSTSSEEKKNRGKNRKEKERRKRQREKRRRKKERLKRKKKIKKNIKKIIREIRKILSRSYRNGTSERKRKTKQLKKFIKDLKKKYKKDRKVVKDIHEVELMKIDEALLKRLNEIRTMNNNFIKNATFRDIIVNGTINRQGARMLIEAYPELVSYFTDTRRNAKDDKRKDYLDYDIEYGMPYY